MTCKHLKIIAILEGVKWHLIVVCALIFVYSAHSPGLGTHDTRCTKIPRDVKKGHWNEWFLISQKSDFRISCFTLIFFKYKLTSKLIQLLLLHTPLLMGW